MDNQTRYCSGFENLEKSGIDGLHPMQHVETIKKCSSKLATLCQTVCQFKYLQKVSIKIKYKHNQEAVTYFHSSEYFCGFFECSLCFGKGMDL